MTTPATYENIKPVPVVSKLSTRDVWAGAAATTDAFMCNCYVNSTGEQAHAVKRPGLAAGLSLASLGLPSTKALGLGPVGANSGSGVGLVAIYGDTPGNIWAAAVLGVTGAETLLSKKLLNFTALSISYPQQPLPFRLGLAPGASVIGVSYIQGVWGIVAWDLGAGTMGTYWSGSPLHTRLTPSLCELNGSWYILSTDLTIQSTTSIENVPFDLIHSVQLNLRGGEAVTMVRYLSYLVAFQTDSFTMYYDAGISPGAAIAPVPNGVFPIGCTLLGSEAVQVFDGIVYWVAGNTKSGYGVWSLAGTTPNPISSPEIDRILYKYFVPTPGLLTGAIETIPPIRALAAGISGHSLYLLTLPTYTLNGVTYTGMTLCYDIELQLWNVWTQSVGGVDAEMQMMYTAINTWTGEQVFIDSLTGGLSSLDSRTYQDLGQPLTVTLQTDPHDWGNQRTKLIPATYVQADTLASSCLLSWSDSDYGVFTAAQTVSTANLKKQVLRCGSTTQRAWRLQHIDNTPMRFYGLEVEVVPGAL